MGVPAKIEEFRPGSPEAVESAVREGWKFRVDSNELFGVRIRQRLQEHGIHDRENPGRGSNSEHQAQHRRGREAEVLAHHSNGKLDVLPERFHRIPPPEKGTFADCGMFLVTADGRRAKRVLVSWPAWSLTCFGFSTLRGRRKELLGGSFCRNLRGRELLARGEPCFQLLSSLVMVRMNEDSGHSFLIHPGDLSSAADRCPERQFEFEIDHRGMLQLSRGANRDPAFAQVGHPGPLIPIRVLSSTGRFTVWRKYRLCSRSII